MKQKNADKLLWIERGKVDANRSQGAKPLSMQSLISLIPRSLSTSRILVEEGRLAEHGGEEFLRPWLVAAS